MSVRRDERIPLEDTFIHGLGPRIDELINERFRRIAQALDKLQERTLIEPAAVKPEKPFDGQIEFADGTNWSPDNTGAAGLYIYSWGTWYRILDSTHASSPGDGPDDHLEDPHYQYWHKVHDPAWAHMYFEDFATPKPLSEGEIFGGYTDNVISDNHVASNLATGKITLLDGGEAPTTGVYQISMNGYVEGSNNGTYVVTLYANGNPTLVRAPVIVPGNAVTASIAWSGVGFFDASVELDIRLEHASSGSLSFYTFNWSMHRISPPAGAEILGVSGNYAARLPVPDDFGRRRR